MNVIKHALSNCSRSLADIKINWVRLFSMQLYPVRVRRETRRGVRLFSMQLYPVRVR